jgi:hypothetical protein
MIPDNLKIYHIVHISKLPAIVAERFLVSDAEVRQRAPTGVTIGMQKIKKRRMSLLLSSRRGLRVGDCVPFYFCPRSPMLYMFWRDNHTEITYHGGQEPIVHLVADLRMTVDWANRNDLRWAFTNSNAGSSYFEDFADLAHLDKVDWDVVQATKWDGHQDKKQAEFLLERCFPWTLVEEIGVYSSKEQSDVSAILATAVNKPPVRIRRAWYY